MTLLSVVEELIEFSEITGTLYTQYQAVNIVYNILHRTGKFGLAIFEWNLMPTVQRTWVRFKQFFGQHTENYTKYPISPWKTRSCTARTWYAMRLHECRRHCIGIKCQQKMQQLSWKQLIMWQTRCKTPSNSCPQSYSR